MTTVDVTGEFQDLNPYDRIYRVDGDFLAKVRVEDNSPSPSIVSFKVTGSWADATGRARTFEDGHFIVEPIEVVIRPDSPTAMADLVEAARVRMANMVCAAAANRQAMEALAGVKPKGADAPAMALAPSEPKA